MYFPYIKIFDIEKYINFLNSLNYRNIILIDNLKLIIIFLTSKNIKISKVYE